MTTLLHFFFFSSFALLISSISALNSDGILLLSFKYSVLSDPLSVLDNWNYDDLTPCAWRGVTCEDFSGSGTPESLMVVSLVLPNSHLLGSIPQDLGMIPHLRSLDLSNNSLNGSLPPSIFNSSELETLSLSSNVIAGDLPRLISGLKSLKLLNLSDNAFAGKLPESLASLKNLTSISLKNNYFSGSVPGGFDYVEVLDLSFNLFNETLPLDFGGEKLRYLNLSNNKLSGTVSAGFAGKIQANATIDLSFNNLAGEIPQVLSLSKQKTEFFAGNLDLCGKPLSRMCTIPSSLSTPPNVTANGSATAAIAAIPKNMDPSPSSSTTTGAPAVADSHSGSKVKPVKIAAIVAGDLAGIGLLAILFLYAYKLRKKKMNQNQNQNQNPRTKPETKIQESKISKDMSSTRALSSKTCSCLNGVTGDETSETATGSDSDHDNNNLTIDVKGGDKQKCLVIVDGETELEMETLLKASAYVLGSSGPSIVYKAVLGGGNGGGGVAFAVRRIGESGVERMREFENTVKIISKLRHPNLLKVRGFYWGEDEKLVIYDYVSNGSLAGAGYRKAGSSPCQSLPFEVRLKIAKGIAMGLAYIHEKKHVHGNIKPSNILLTLEMEPIISDFGLEWLISGKHSHKAKGSNRHFGSKRSISSREEMMINHDYHHSASSSPYMAPATGLLGCTSPYHAPESMKSLKPNPKWDVYSFGIVLLELISGKVFSERELGEWSASSSDIDDENSILRLVDMSVRTDNNGRRDATLTCFKLGFNCASLDPQKRPSMKEALHVLEKIPFSSC
ncbi:unnamed protein product [Lactuca saligna]|uniref:Protein kinase domain-containing protein n=1 Tax=Lactuca saligna TaxID=75948 RepID=A0AA35UZR2_LACSI|nr:unnamed protein product [Lactuca saligna]